VLDEASIKKMRNSYEFYSENLNTCGHLGVKRRRGNNIETDVKTKEDKGILSKFIRLSKRNFRLYKIYNQLFKKKSPTQIY
jgi:ribosomal protein S8